MACNRPISGCKQKVESLCLSISNLPFKGNEAAWVGMVYTNKPWDYKNNSSTIFGVAWEFDKNANNGFKTSFRSTFTTFNNAADFGNYNAGYTGTYAGVPQQIQFSLAGMGKL